MSSAPQAPAQKSAALETNEAFYGELRPGVQDYWRKMAAPRFRVATVLRELEKESPRTIVDLGCGNGALCEEIHARFPDAVVGRYARATLTLTLACPSGRCDAWDRVAALSLLADSGDGGAATELEFARFVTPYGVGGTWTVDLSDLMPLFVGERRVRAFIDTWVGPGHAQGNGWLVTASIAFEPGTPEHPTRAVIPLGWTRVVYGDPARPVAVQLPPRTVNIPAGTRGARVWVSATGHGQGNRDNCAEFCSRVHAVRFDDARVEHELWRDDCAQNPVNTQRGNWQPPRAGWCPGDVAPAWVADLPAPTAGTHTVSYEVQDYVNSCRPGATPCQNCVFRTTCDYNDSSHTEPYYRLAAYLLLTD